MSPKSSSPRKETPLGDDDHRGLENFFRSIKKIPQIPVEELPEVYARLKRGDKEARERLILSNLMFAARLSYSFCRHFHIPVEDLFQEAILGLIKATEKWDITRGGFLICARQWIECNLHLAVAKYYRYSKPLITIEEHLWHDSTEEDAATIAGTLESPDTTPISEAKLTAHSLLMRLDPRSRQIIVLRYGLNGEEPMTGAEVGKMLGITRQRISKIEIGALETMRRRATRHRLRLQPTPPQMKIAA